MKVALFAFLVAAAFSTATILGVFRFGSSPPAPAVIVLRGHDGVTTRAGVVPALRFGRTAVWQRVGLANLSGYHVGRAHGERP